MEEKKTCPYSERCWKHSYNLFYKQKNGWGAVSAPARGALIMGGFCKGVLLQTRKNRKGNVVNKGLWCDVLPERGKPETFCPLFTSLPLQSCSIYEKEKKREDDKKQWIKSRGLKQRPHIDISVKKAVALRDRYFCYYCDRHNSLLNKEGIRCVIDHIIPYSIGGSNEMLNLCFCCNECNSLKSDKIWEKGCRSEIYKKNSSD